MGLCVGLRLYPGLLHAKQTAYMPIPNMIHDVFQKSGTTSQFDLLPETPWPQVWEGQELDEDEAGDGGTLPQF